MLRKPVVSKLYKVKNDDADAEAQHRSADYVARVVLAEIGSGIANYHCPQEYEQGEKPRVCSLAAETEAKECGQGKDIGSMGGNKAIQAATGGAEHAHMVKSLAGA